MGSFLSGLVLFGAGAIMIYLGVRALYEQQHEDEDEPILTAAEAAWLDWNGIECPWAYDDEEEDAQP